MNRDGDALVQAFRDFNVRSDRLAHEYHRLSTRVRSLDEDLARANRRLGRALHAARRDRRTLHHLLSNLSCGVLIVGPRKEIRFANQPARRLVRLATREPLVEGALLSGRLAELVTESGTDGSEARRTVDLPAPAGERSVDVMVSRTAQGEDEEILILLDDVTRARDRQQGAARATRLDAMGRMAAEVAHEVRNPLGSVELFAGLLARELKDDPEHREMVEMVLLGVRSIDAVMRNMLAFSRLFPAPRQQVDLHRIASEAVRLTAPAARARDIDLGFQARSPLSVTGNEELLRQVLLNLIQNALEATAAGGRVRVRLLGTRGSAVLSVQDTGCGMTPEQQDRMFDPFFTARDGGTGLGLAVVHRLVEHHGGRIEVRSRPGRGTRFRVRLPAAAPSSSQEEAA